jgi:plastocyanin
MTMTDGRSSVQRPRERNASLAPWQRLLVVVAVADVSSAVVIQAFLARQIIPPQLVVSVLLAIGAAAVWRGGVERRGTIAFGALALIFFAGGASHSMPELGHLDGGVPFVVGLILLLAGFLALLALIGALIRLPASLASRAPLAAATAILVIGAIACAVSTANATDERAHAGDAELAAHQISFVPGHLDVKRGQAVHIVNRDPVRHTFTIDGHVSVDVSPGGARRVGLDLPSGTYTYHCVVPGHDMKGTLSVG